MLSRRAFVAASLTLPGWLPGAPPRFSALAASLGRLEQANGGRLGVALLDTASGERAGYRAGERFPMCSTFKFLLAAAVLKRVDSRSELLGRSLDVPAKPLLSHSPLTEGHAGAGMTIAELCEAVLTQSDNTAANLLLATLGGPAGLTSFARSIDDQVTRLDRTELALNQALAGDPRDTTSPQAMADDLDKLLLGAVLSGPSREQLTAWMAAAVTGLSQLRAALPPGWRALDKTGSNGTHTGNDIAVFWPPGRRPVIVTAYITQCFGPDSKRAAMLAAVGRLVVEALAV